MSAANNDYSSGGTVTLATGSSYITSGKTLTIRSELPRTQTYNLDTGGDLNLDGNNSLINIDAITSLDGVGGDIRISDNSSLESVQGLQGMVGVNGNLQIHDNPKLPSLAGLDNVDGVNGTLSIMGNTSLTSLQGLEGVEFVSSLLTIRSNDSLASLQGLEGLGSVGFNLTIHGPGIFFHPEKWSLGLKIERSAFTAVITNFCRSQCMIFTQPAIWNRLHVVRCTVQPEFLTPPTPAGAHASSPRFVCVGRLCPEKGQILLVRAVRDLIAEHHPLTLRLVGDGPSRQAIEAEIEMHGLKDHIQLLGWQASETVRAEIAEATAFVLPSFAEGLPVVIMEALALGRPVITTRIAGIPELVENGTNGWLIAPGSQSEITRALREAVQCPASTLDEMGAEGTRRVRELHNPDIEIPRLEKLFRDYLA